MNNTSNNKASSSTTGLATGIAPSLEASFPGQVHETCGGGIVLRV